MNLARARESDFAAVDRLESVVNSLCEFGEFPPQRKSAPVGEGEIVRPTDIPQRLGNFVIDWWEQYSASWFRVVFGGKTAIENACDPESDILEFLPIYKHADDLLAALVDNFDAIETHFTAEAKRFPSDSDHVVKGLEQIRAAIAAAKGTITEVATEPKPKKKKGKKAHA